MKPGSQEAFVQMHHLRVTALAAGRRMLHHQETCRQCFIGDYCPLGWELHVDMESAACDLDDARQVFSEAIP